MYFRVNKFEVGANDRIFSGNEQQKVYLKFFMAKLLSEVSFSPSISV